LTPFLQHSNILVSSFTEEKWFEAQVIFKIQNRFPRFLLLSSGNYALNQFIYEDEESSYMSLIKQSDTYRKLTAQVPKEQTFKFGEGRYSAKIKKGRRKDRQNAEGANPYIRILFRVNVPGLERYECLAKADFPLNLENGTDLRNIINRLLGKDYLANLSGQEFDFAVLEGLDCEIEVEHVNLEGREKYDYPLVVVKDIQKPGTMCLTGCKEAKL